MQILTFSPVPVVLSEIYGLKWIIGCLCLVFAGPGWSRSIVRSAALVVT